ncbi:hypothetical protein V6N13_040934 [Hibiscus sabdariffa]
MELLRRAEPFDSDSAIVFRPRKCLLTPKWPSENTVGLDSEVEEVWKALEDQTVATIRVCGRAGGGLKKVSDEFHRRSHDFDCVIWAEVPTGQGYVQRVQEEIRKNLDIPDDIWNRCSAVGVKWAKIFSVLEGTKFVLLLDNVWEHFDLETLGFPSKVIFTTSKMSLFLNFGIKTQTVTVHCLPPELASTLFWTTVGERVGSVLRSDPDLLELANKFVRRCKRLATCSPHFCTSPCSSKKSSTMPPHNRAVP